MGWMMEQLLSGIEIGKGTFNMSANFNKFIDWKKKSNPSMQQWECSVHSPNSHIRITSASYIFLNWTLLFRAGVMARWVKAPSMMVSHVDTSSYRRSSCRIQHRTCGMGKAEDDLWVWGPSSSMGNQDKFPASFFSPLPVLPIAANLGSKPQLETISPCVSLALR